MGGDLRWTIVLTMRPFTKQIKGEIPVIHQVTRTAKRNPPVNPRKTSGYTITAQTFLMFFQHKFFKAVLVGAVLNFTEIVGNRTEKIQGLKMILRIHFHFLLLNVTLLLLVHTSRNEP